MGDSVYTMHYTVYTSGKFLRLELLNHINQLSTGVLGFVIAIYLRVFQFAPAQTAQQIRASN